MEFGPRPYAVPTTWEMLRPAVGLRSRKERASGQHEGSLAKMIQSELASAKGTPILPNKLNCSSCLRL